MSCTLSTVLIIFMGAMCYSTSVAHMQSDIGFKITRSGLPTNTT